MVGIVHTIELYHFGSAPAIGDDTMVSDTTPSRHDRLLFVSLFLFEASLLVIFLALEVKGETHIDLFLSTRPGLAFLCAGMGFLVAGAVLIYLYLASRRSPSRNFRLIVGMNLVTVLLILVVGEMVVRVGARTYLDGEAFGNVALKPKAWDRTVRHYRHVIEKASDDLSYLVYDDGMGWSVGTNGRSANGLYLSSPRGVRALREGVAFTMDEGKTNIVLVGDSYTFGEEVRYEESWGYYVDQLLGEQVQVLNLGVPGYGVDQAYLRYERDANHWKPKVSIFGLFSHDLLRTMTVYPFLANPQWEMPFSKPRFILADGTLERMNEPPLRPEAIFSPPSIFDLPYLELDRGYEKSNWQHSFYHASYLFRLLVSLFPSWSAEPLGFSEDVMVSINAAIMTSYVRAAALEGTIPLVVYLPGRWELERSSSSPTVAERVLHEAGIGYIDPTSCLLEVDPADRYMPGGHYTPTGNAAVAKCLFPVIQEALAQAAVGQDPALADRSP